MLRNDGGVDVIIDGNHWSTPMSAALDAPPPAALASGRTAFSCFASLSPTKRSGEASNQARPITALPWL
jgi:hypothetical protein